MGALLSRTSSRLRGLRTDDRGTTAIEYGLIASGVALAIMSTVWGLGDSVRTNLYDKLATLF